MFTSGCGHIHMRDTYLLCPECRSPRESKRGLIQNRSGDLQPVWYLGCGCAKPSGLL